MSGVVIIGGGGLRTPLLVHGLVQERRALGIDEVVLYDVDLDHARQMAALGERVIAAAGGGLGLRVAETLEAALPGARFVVLSVRVGGMAARARDERVILEAGAVGQETTGPGGMAMALRTLPVLLDQARLIARLAPDAWVINFTNPAGLITQALTEHTPLRVVGICDTPGELFHNIARALGRPLDELSCDYLGLNHLGWVRRVLCDAEDLLPRLLADPAALAGLYEAPLFDPALVQGLGLIPSEYLFFYYGRGRALANQRATGTTRGQVLEALNRALWDELAAHLEAGDGAAALARYRAYLQGRSASYMRLEAEGAPGAGAGDAEPDPFAAATGYHRIAVAVMRALAGDGAARLVVNVPGRGAIAELEEADVVEVPCQVDAAGVRPLACGRLPAAVRGLVLAVKAYERWTIRAAMEGATALARQALVAHPLVGDDEQAERLVEALVRSDPDGLGYLEG